VVMGMNLWFPQQQKLLEHLIHYRKIMEELYIGESVSQSVSQLLDLVYLFS